jgi:hypothetical protein
MCSFRVAKSTVTGSIDFKYGMEYNRVTIEFPGDVANGMGNHLLTTGNSND